MPDDGTPFTFLSSPRTRQDHSPAANICLPRRLLLCQIKTLRTATTTPLHKYNKAHSNNHTYSVACSQEGKEKRFGGRRKREREEQPTKKLHHEGHGSPFACGDYDRRGSFCSVPSEQTRKHSTAASISACTAATGAKGGGERGRRCAESPSYACIFVQPPH